MDWRKIGLFFLIGFGYPAIIGGFDLISGRAQKDFGQDGIAFFIACPTILMPFIITLLSLFAVARHTIVNSKILWASAIVLLEAVAFILMAFSTDENDFRNYIFIPAAYIAPSMWLLAFLIFDYCFERMKALDARKEEHEQCADTTC